MAAGELSMLPSGAYLTLYICHVFSSTIALVNCSGENMLKRDILRRFYGISNISCMREQIMPGPFPNLKGLGTRLIKGRLTVEGKLRKWPSTFG